MNEALEHWLQEQLAKLQASSGRAELAALGAIQRTDALLVEASQRRFYRVILDHGSLVAMTSPPALERNDAFVALGTLFLNAGIPVPELFAQDAEQGYFLMQDLGSADLRACYATAEEPAAMAAAIELLPTLQGVRSPLVTPYTAQRLHDELQIFSDWLLRDTLHQTAPAVFAEACERLVHSATEQPQVCIHRDYHCRNLLWNNGQLGVVDFQDALHGPYSYDLASLLHDCYYHWDSRLRDRYREHGRRCLAPAVEPDRFQQQLEWMAIQRQLKAMGIFLRLQLRDGRPSHLDHVLPTLRQTIELCAGYRELEAASQWLRTLVDPLAQRLPVLVA